MSGKGPFGQDYLTRKKFVNNASYNYKKGDFSPGDTNDCESETGSSQDSVEIIGEVQAQSKLKNKSTMKTLKSERPMVFFEVICTALTDLNNFNIDIQSND